MMRGLLLMLSLVSLALSQDGAIRGPVSGVVFDSATSSVRALIGVPGAAYFSDPVAAGLENAFVSPDGAWILAARNGAILSIAVAGGGQHVIAEADLAAASFTRASDRAAIAASGRLLLVRRDASVIGLGPAPGPVTAMALDHSGRQLFVAVSGERAGVYLFREGEPVKDLARLANARGLALTESSLFVLDRDAGQVLEIRNLDQGGAALFASGFEQATGLAMSPDGRTVLVSDAATRSISLFDRSGASRGRIELSFTPSRLESAGESPLFLLNHRDAKHPLEVLAFQPEPAAYFVPAPEED